MMPGVDGNREILRNIENFRIGQRLLVGTSRKTFIGKITGSPVEERLPGTACKFCMPFMWND